MTVQHKNQILNMNFSYIFSSFPLFVSRSFSPLFCLQIEFSQKLILMHIISYCVDVHCFAAMIKTMKNNCLMFSIFKFICICIYCSRTCKIYACSIEINSILIFVYRLSFIDDDSFISCLCSLLCYFNEIGNWFFSIDKTRLWLLTFITMIIIIIPRRVCSMSRRHLFETICFTHTPTQLFNIFWNRCDFLFSKISWRNVSNILMIWQRQSGISMHKSF